MRVAIPESGVRPNYRRWGVATAAMGFGAGKIKCFLMAAFDDRGVSSLDEREVGGELLGSRGLWFV